LERLNKRVSKQFALWYKDKDIRDEQWSHVPGGVMVTFRENGLQQMISFNDRGKWLFTISYLDEQQLPEKIRVQIKTGFRSYKIFGVESISGPSATVFLAHIQNGNSWKVIRIHNENIEVQQDFIKSE
jgi:hypothetical protein